MICKNNIQRGFTALELLVVLGIIGILMAIALAGISFSRIKARDSVRIADVKAVMLALEQYRDVCREYPQDIYSATVMNNGCPTNISWETFMSDGTPVDPSGDPYFYIALQQNGVCSRYHIGATLEQSDNKYLLSDDDFSSIGQPACLPGNAFNGSPSPDTVYDIMK